MRGKTDSQEGDRLEVKLLERFSFFFFNSERVETMKHVVLPMLTRTKTCLLLKVIENEMNQSESAHSFCTAHAPKQTSSLHLLKIPTEGGSAK